MSNIDKMNSVRLSNMLNKLYSHNGKVVSLRDLLLSRAYPMECTTSDEMIDWSRTKFNQMNYQEQKEYEISLKNKKYFWVNGIKVNETVYNWALDYNRNY